MCSPKCVDMFSMNTWVWRKGRGTVRLAHSGTSQSIKGQWHSQPTSPRVWSDFAVHPGAEAATKWWTPNSSHVLCERKMIDFKRFKGSPSLRRLRHENGKVFKGSISRSGIMNSARLGAGVGKCVCVWKFGYHTFNHTRPRVTSPTPNTCCTACWRYRRNARWILTTARCRLYKACMACMACVQAKSSH